MSVTANPSARPLPDCHTLLAETENTSNRKIIVGGVGPLSMILKEGSAAMDESKYRLWNIIFKWIGLAGLVISGLWAIHKYSEDSKERCRAVGRVADEGAESRHAPA
jgi:hypothetical protein